MNVGIHKKCAQRLYSSIHFMVPIIIKEVREIEGGTMRMNELTLCACRFYFLFLWTRIHKKIQRKGTYFGSKRNGNAACLAITPKYWIKLLNGRISTFLFIFYL
jgi:hypothetical protein